MSEGYRTAAEVPHCARCKKALAVSELIMTGAGEWYCQPCIAEGQAKVANRLASENWRTSTMPESCLMFGCFVPGMIMILFVLVWTIGSTFSAH
jgi:hypothetical protein